MILSNGDLLKALLGAGEHNPHQTVFIAPPLGRDGKGGLIIAGSSLILMDIWGKPYRIIMDTDGNGSITDPEQPGSMISRKIIIWSAGEDGDFDTWHDNVPNWRS